MPWFSTSTLWRSCCGGFDVLSLSDFGIMEEFAVLWFLAMTLWKNLLCFGFRLWRRGVICCALVSALTSWRKLL